MLQSPTDFSDNDLVARAQALKMDIPAFKTCLDSGRHDESIKAAQKWGSDLGVNGTPAFFVNGRFLNGARPMEQFEQIIDDELKRVASN